MISLNITQNNTLAYTVPVPKGADAFVLGGGTPPAPPFLPGRHVSLLPNTHSVLLNLLSSIVEYGLGVWSFCQIKSKDENISYFADLIKGGMQVYENPPGADLGFIHVHPMSRATAEGVTITEINSFIEELKQVFIHHIDKFKERVSEFYQKYSQEQIQEWRKSILKLSPVNSLFERAIIAGNERSPEKFLENLSTLLDSYSVTVTNGFFQNKLQAKTFSEVVGKFLVKVYGVENPYNADYFINKNNVEIKEFIAKNPLAVPYIFQSAQSSASQRICYRIAAITGSTLALDWLIKNKCSSEVFNYETLMDVASKGALGGHLNICEWVLKQTQINDQFDKGELLKKIAIMGAFQGHHSVIEWLDEQAFFQRAADKKTIDNMFVYAATDGHSSIINKLFEHPLVKQHLSSEIVQEIAKIAFMGGHTSILNILLRLDAFQTLLTEEYFRTAAIDATIQNNANILAWLMAREGFREAIDKSTLEEMLLHALSPSRERIRELLENHKRDLLESK